MPKISVITPCYNGFDLMERYFRSLENQTFKDFEAIIVDDCSTDNSYHELISFKEKTCLNLKILKTEINSGPGEARNVAISKSSGEYLAFCDCDDWYDDDFLDSMFNKISCTCSDIVMCDYKKVSESGKIEYPEYTALFDEKTSKNEYLAYSKDSFSLLIIKRDLFNGIIIPKLYNGEDVAVIPQLVAKAKKIAVIKKPLYNYYTRSDSMSNKPKQDIYKSFMKSFNIINAAIGKEFPEECEFIGIKTVLYGATLNALKADIPMEKTADIAEGFFDIYPNAFKNKYFKNYDMEKRAYIYCLKMHINFMIKAYIWMHKRYTRQS